MQNVELSEFDCCLGNVMELNKSEIFRDIIVSGKAVMLGAMPVFVSIVVGDTVDYTFMQHCIALFCNYLLYFIMILLVCMALVSTM